MRRLAACTAALWCPVALPLPDWRLAGAGCVAIAACWGVAAWRKDILESVREKCDLRFWVVQCLLEGLQLWLWLRLVGWWVGWKCLSRPTLTRSSSLFSTLHPSTGQGCARP